VLREHSGVRDAAVVVQQEPGGEKRLVGYVVKKEGEEELKPGQLRSYLQERLPEYMVPARLVMLEQIPLMPNGKIDRKALPAAELVGEAENYVAPRNEVEEILCGIWEQVLGVTRVGVKDNFFELGGHSLLATQVMARVENIFEAEVPLHVLFETPTVAGLAERLQQQESNMEELLSEVESLSEGEIEALLGAQVENEGK
jgi:acyl carrier protein